jgi:hypothetical protein
MPWWGIMLIIIAIALVLMIVLYIVGSRMQKKQAAQKEEAMKAAQPVTMLVIDKKMMPMQDAKLPKIVMESTPKRFRKAKLPIVKAKIGPQITTLICDDTIFDSVPVKGEVKAMVSGIYITSVKNVRGKVEAPAKKKSFGRKLRAKQAEYQEAYNQESKLRNQSKEEKAAAKAKAKEEKERAKKVNIK